MKNEIYELCQRFADKHPATFAGQEMRDVLAQPQVSEEQVAIVLLDAEDNNDAKQILARLGVDFEAIY